MQQNRYPRDALRHLESFSRQEPLRSRYGLKWSSAGRMILLLVYAYPTVPDPDPETCFEATAVRTFMKQEVLAGICHELHFA